jgi:phosphoribosylaminoimidazolecarboxamide formyltransferase/IMP cyclohydrolase
MRLLGSPVLDVYGGHWLNVHPALLPSFPGMHAVSDALAYGVKVTGVTVFLVDGRGHRAGRVAGGYRVMPDDDWDSLSADHAAERGCRRVEGADRGRLGWKAGTSVSGAGRWLTRSRSAARSGGVYDKTGVVEAGWVGGAGRDAGVSGGTAQALREAGLPVTVRT